MAPPAPPEGVRIIAALSQLISTIHALSKFALESSPQHQLPFAQIAGPNMMVFIKKLRQLVPKMIISQPAYGFPPVKSFWVNEKGRKTKWSQSRGTSGHGEQLSANRPSGAFNCIYSVSATVSFC